MLLPLPARVPVQGLVVVHQLPHARRPVQLGLCLSGIGIVPGPQLHQLLAKLPPPGRVVVHWLGRVGLSGRAGRAGTEERRLLVLLPAEGAPGVAGSHRAKVVPLALSAIPAAGDKGGSDGAELGLVRHGGGVLVGGEPSRRPEVSTGSGEGAPAAGGGGSPDRAELVVPGHPRRRGSWSFLFVFCSKSRGGELVLNSPVGLAGLEPVLLLLDGPGGAQRQLEAVLVLSLSSSVGRCSAIGQLGLGNGELGVEGGSGPDNGGGRGSVASVAAAAAVGVDVGTVLGSFIHEVVVVAGSVPAVGVISLRGVLRKKRQGCVVCGKEKKKKKLEGKANSI